MADFQVQVMGKSNKKTEELPRRGLVNEGEAIANLWISKNTEYRLGIKLYVVIYFLFG